MGSSGSGRFSDYTGSAKKTESNGGASGGSSGEDKCRQAFSTGLEDIEHYDYYKNHGQIPPNGSSLTLELRGRVVAVSDTGESVGALPTQYNYIAGCLQSGIRYVGIIINSAAAPVMRIDVDFAAV
ncbi:hypothetical protein [Pleomorphomonas oryzae]|uniref:hypothetical protein n=1 Tax=Pleomorphomonas oryzae TaxID=261934 RepID=UPI00047EBEF4|nr:hypothetical protein [Pleomorphomonas oryzae]